MQSSRDSSVWRSLAVAFGDGVAFGVGVKLSQGATSLAGGASGQPESDSGTLADRLLQMERRLAQVEKVRTLPQGTPAFDPKVLEAVVNAIDARLKEQAAVAERRIAELEARFATELKALRQQDEAIATAVEGHLEELQDHFIAQVEAVRQQVEQDHAAMQQEVAAAVKEVSESAIQTASEAVIEQSLAPVRAEVAEKDRQIAGLRQRIEDSDQAMLEVLNGIAGVIRQASERRSPATEPGTVPAEPAAARPKEDAAVVPDPQIPSFAQAAKPTRLWRVPLVSSMVIASFGLVIVHYL